MNRINVHLSWINAWGYCLVLGLAIILHAWGLAAMSAAGIFIAHQLLIRTENRHGIHGAPKDPAQ